MKLKQSMIYEEYSEGDGYWIVLKPGWKWVGDMAGAVHAIHEPTKSQAHRQGVIPCACPDCKNP